MSHDEWIFTCESSVINKTMIYMIEIIFYLSVFLKNISFVLIFFLICFTKKNTLCITKELTFANVDLYNF